MTEMSEFLNARSKVQWDFNVDSEQHMFSAKHPANLNAFTWLLSTKRYNKPIITEGKAKVVKRKNQWSIIAGKGKKLIFTSTTIK